MPLCLLWLGRCALLTGNPFYSLDLAGLFPTNDLFRIWSEHDRSLHANVLSDAAGWRSVLRLLALFAPAALPGWLPGRS